MPDKILYISDLDGTLLSPDESITPYTAQMLNALIEKGLLFTYATARSLATAGVLTRSLHLQLPVILNNGVFLTDSATGKILHTMTLKADQKSRVLTIIAQHHIPALVYALLDGRERVSWLGAWENNGIRLYIAARIGDERLRRVENLAALGAGEIFYITILAEEAEARRLESLFSGDESLTRLLSEDIYHRKEWWLELYHRDASKATAAETLRRRIGADRIVCFGDGLNDLPLFRACSEALAMGNAHPLVKQAATAVIGANCEDGVVRWLLENGVWDRG
jgi:Cof subfamily protein (haloacid dehalogenase superfamily)